MFPLIFVATVFLMASPALCANRTVENSCPSDAVQEFGSERFRIRDNFCYHFTRYPRLTYEGALEKCQSYQGTLAMPKTKDVNDYLRRELRNLPTILAMWIGMNDKKNEGTYVWEDGTSVRPWGNMDRGTGGLFGNKEDCIALDPGDGKWHDYKCETIKMYSTFSLSRDLQLGYICQYEIKDD